MLRRSCVMQKDDDEGKLGMKIGRDLMCVAGKALRQNITELGPRVLPLSEQLIFAGNFVARKVLVALLSVKRLPWDHAGCRCLGTFTSAGSPQTEHALVRRSCTWHKPCLMPFT